MHAKSFLHDIYVERSHEFWGVHSPESTIDSECTPGVHVYPRSALPESTVPPECTPKLRGVHSPRSTLGVHGESKGGTSDECQVVQEQSKLSLVYLSFFVGVSPTPPYFHYCIAKIKVLCPLNLRGEDLFSLFFHREEQNDDQDVDR